MLVDKSMWSLPLNQTTLDLQKSLKRKVQGWLIDSNGEFMVTKSLFYKVLTKPQRSWLGCPLKALEKIALEQTCEVKDMYPDSQHIFLCPMFMNSQWDCMLSRIAVTQFTFVQKSCLWSKEIHEPLTTAFLVPLLSSAPWKLSQHNRMVELQRQLFKIQHSNTQDERSHMRKFWMLG